MGIACLLSTRAGLDQLSNNTIRILSPAFRHHLLLDGVYRLLRPLYTIGQGGTAWVALIPLVRRNMLACFWKCTIFLNLLLLLRALDLVHVRCLLVALRAWSVRYTISSQVLVILPDLLRMLHFLWPLLRIILVLRLNAPYAAFWISLLEGLGAYRLREQLLIPMVPLLLLVDREVLTCFFLSYQLTIWAVYFLARKLTIAEWLSGRHT